MKSVLIIGVGQFGSHIAKRMEELRCEVMAVDINEECINEIMPYVTDAMIGDGTNEEFLRSLGIGNYDVCIFFSQRDKTRVLRCKDKNSAFLQQFINSHKKWFNIRNIHNCHIRNCIRKGSISF